MQNSQDAPSEVPRLDELAISDSRPGFTDTSPWSGFPLEVMQQVTALLEGQSLASCRLACHAWRQAVAESVFKLRPKMGGALGLSWNALPHAGQLFPRAATLDLRRYSVMNFHVAELRRLPPSITRLQLINMERMARPSAYLAELKSLLEALGALPPRLAVEFDLFVAESPFARSYMLSDAELRTITAMPPSVALTTLHLNQSLSYNISAAGLAAVTALASLRHLHLVTYNAGLRDPQFGQLSALTSLQRLWFGTVPEVTDEGFRAGLAPLSNLTDLTLVSVTSITDAGLAGLAQALAPHLENLALIRCPALTNASAPHFAAMRRLTGLYLSDNDQISITGGLEALAALPNLKLLDLRRCSHIEASEAERVLTSCRMHPDAQP